MANENEEQPITESGEGRLVPAENSSQASGAEAEGEVDVSKSRI